MISNEINEKSNKKMNKLVKKIYGIMKRLPFIIPNNLEYYLASVTD